MNLLHHQVLRPPIESAQYLSIRYTNRLTQTGIEPSVGSVGDSYDNALAESVIGLYKTELIRQKGPWRNLDQVNYATLEYVDWFNHRRLLEPIGDIPPTEKEANYYREHTPAPLAVLKQNTLRQTRYGSRNRTPTHPQNTPDHQPRTRQHPPTLTSRQPTPKQP